MLANLMNQSEASLQRTPARTDVGSNLIGSMEEHATLFIIVCCYFAFSQVGILPIFVPRFGAFVIGLSGD